MHFYWCFLLLCCVPIAAVTLQISPTLGLIRDYHILSVILAYLFFLSFGDLNHCPPLILVLVSSCKRQIFITKCDRSTRRGVDASMSIWCHNPNMPLDWLYGVWKRKRSPAVCLIQLETTQRGSCQWRYPIHSVDNTAVSISGGCRTILRSYEKLSSVSSQAPFNYVHTVKIWSTPPPLHSLFFFVSPSAYHLFWTVITLSNMFLYVQQYVHSLSGCHFDLSSKAKNKHTPGY